MFTKGGKPDLWLFIAVIALLSIGLVMVFSASSVMGLTEFGNPYHYVQRQSILALVGLILLFLLMKLDYHVFKILALPGVVLSLILLVAVLFVGHGAGGATRWIRLPGFNLQPSEISKLVMVNYTALYLANKRETARKFFKGLLPILFITGLQFGLIMLEPDFGTGMALVFTVVVMLFAGGVHLGQLLFVATSTVPVLAYLVSLKAYRMKRLFAFLDPWSDPTDAGWNVIQSLLAIGSGGLTGLGLGQSRQKFSYLPEHHTDFIFAILCEEWGFVGGFFVIALFFLIAWRGIRTAMRAPDLYGTLLAIGITSMIAFQAMLNIGVVSGSLPVTGIPLPFISHGGSSLLVSLAGMGILLNISRQCND